MVSLPSYLFVGNPNTWIYAFYIETRPWSQKNSTLLMAKLILNETFNAEMRIVPAGVLCILETIESFEQMRLNLLF